MPHSQGAHACLEAPCSPQPPTVHSPHNSTLQQEPDHLVVMANGDVAQGICCPFIHSLLVFQHELKQSKCAYPSMPSGIKIGCGEDISQWVVVSPYYKWCVSKILFEVLHDTPFKSKELELRTMIVLFQGCERVAPKCDRVVVPIILLL